MKKELSDYFREYDDGEKSPVGRRFVIIFGAFVLIGLIGIIIGLSRFL